MVRLKGPHHVTEQTESRPGASMKALETAAMSLLTEMVRDNDPRPSPEAVRIAARLMARKAYEAQGKGRDLGEAPE